LARILREGDIDGVNGRHVRFDNSLRNRREDDLTTLSGSHFLLPEADEGTDVSERAGCC